LTAFFAGLLLAAVVVAVPVRAQTSVVIRVLSVQTSVAYHDQLPKGSSPGDVIVQRDRLLNAARQFGRAAGAPVGSDTAFVRIVTASTGVMTDRATFPDGTVTVEGTLSLEPHRPITIPVVGGTGRYRHAHGVYIEPGGGGPSGELNIFRLVVP
jgi:hypothetical protein